MQYWIGEKLLSRLHRMLKKGGRNKKGEIYCNPGCFATAIHLGIMPLQAHKLDKTGTINAVHQVVPELE